VSARASKCALAARSGSQDKLLAVADWRSSKLFSEKERLALAYILHSPWAGIAIAALNRADKFCRPIRAVSSVSAREHDPRGAEREPGQAAGGRRLAQQ
jgi:hypothetical protein